MNVYVYCGYLGIVCILISYILDYLLEATVSLYKILVKNMGDWLMYVQTIMDSSYNNSATYGEGSLVWAKISGYPW